MIETPEISDAERREKNFVVTITLLATFLALALVGLAFGYWLRRREWAFHRGVDAMRRREILTLKDQVRTLQGEIAYCVCPNRLAPHLSPYTVDPGEWVQQQQSQDPAQAQPHAPENRSRASIRPDDVPVEEEGHGQIYPETEYDNTRRESSGTAQLRELNQHREHYLQTLPNVDECFVVGDDSDVGSPRAPLPPASNDSRIRRLA